MVRDTPPVPVRKPTTPAERSMSTERSSGPELIKAPKKKKK